MLHISGCYSKCKQLKILKIYQIKTIITLDLKKTLKTPVQSLLQFVI